MAKQSDDALMKAIGAALHSWSLVELQLAKTFSSLVGFDSARNGQLIFSAIISFETRLNLCDKFVFRDACDDLDRALWMALSKRTRKGYQSRHQLAHFTRLFDDAGKPHIRPFLTLENWNVPNPTILSASEIDDRAKRFLELQKALGWYARFFVLRRTGGQEERIARLKPPPLISHLYEGLEGRGGG